MRGIDRCGLAYSSLQERPRNTLIAFANDRRVVKPRAEINCSISTSLDSQESSEANTIKDRPRLIGTDGDESGEDPPEQKPSKLKRRQVAHYLSLQNVSASFRGSAT